MSLTSYIVINNNYIKIKINLLFYDDEKQLALVLVLLNIQFLFWEIKVRIMV